MDTTKQDWDRHLMWWQILGDEYPAATRNERKRMKTEYASKHSLLPCQITGLEPCLPTSMYTYLEQQERSMIYMDHPRDEALEHLTTRLSRISYDHKDKLHTHYHMRETYPKDDKEAQEWFDKGYFSHSQGYMRWGPKADEEGYHAALEKLQQHKTHAEDIIRVKTDEDARLKALHDFESATFH